MKSRTVGFLRDEIISHESEQFDYIAELHDYLWRFVRTVNPSASGDLRNFLDDAIIKAETTYATRTTHI